MYRSAVWPLLVLFLMITGFVYWIYTSFPPLSSMHPLNWILSYVACALFVAMLTRVCIDFLNLENGESA
jgi:hypothetical protein